MQALRMCLVVLLCACFNTTIYAFQQPPYLERLVTVNADNQKMSDVFKAISKQTEVIFSYTGFNAEQRVTRSYYRVPLKKVLDDLLKNFEGTYALNGKYIIIHFDSPTNSLAITGYIYNSIDSTRIENADIYLKENQYMTVSDQAGFFSVEYPKSLSKALLLFKKDGYKDVNLVISGKSKKEVAVYMNPIPIFSIIKRRDTDSLLLDMKYGLPKTSMKLRNQEAIQQMLITEQHVKPVSEYDNPASPKLHHITRLGIHAAIAVPTEGKLQQNNTQIGVLANYFINSKLAIGVNASRNSFALNNEPNYEYFRCSVTEFSVSVGYYFGKEKWQPHFGASAGLYSNKVDYSYSYYALPYPAAYYANQIVVTKSETENKFGYAPEAGVLYEITNRINFDASLKYHVIVSGYGTIPYWGITAGFLFNL